MKLNETREELDSALCCQEKSIFDGSNQGACESAFGEGTSIDKQAEELNYKAILLAKEVDELMIDISLEMRRLMSTANDFATRADDLEKKYACRCGEDG